MSTQPSSEPIVMTDSSDQQDHQVSETLSSDREQERATLFPELQEQQVNLKLEVERLYRDVEGLRGWFQTLVSGLVIAMLIAIAISSWFAYRLLVQEELARQQSAKALEANAEMQVHVEQLEAEFQRQNELLKQLNTDLQDLAEVNDNIQKNQENLRALDDRLTEAEAGISELGELEVSASSDEEESDS